MISNEAVAAIGWGLFGTLCLCAVGLLLAVQAHRAKKQATPPATKYAGQSNTGIWDAEVVVVWRDGRKSVMWHDTFTAKSRAYHAAAQQEDKVYRALKKSQSNDETIEHYALEYLLDTEVCERPVGQPYYRIELYRLPGH